MRNNLRVADRLEATRMGVEPEKALFHSYRQAIYRQTALIDNKVAAMWGVVGMSLGIVGVPYLITTPFVETISPIVFARIYKSEVTIMKNIFPVLENYVDAKYEGAKRMLKIAGFKLSEPEGSSAFQKFTLRGSI